MPKNPPSYSQARPFANTCVFSQVFAHPTHPSTHKHQSYADLDFTPDAARNSQCLWGTDDNPVYFRMGEPCEYRIDVKVKDQFKNDVAFPGWHIHNCDQGQGDSASDVSIIQRRLMAATASGAKKSRSKSRALRELEDTNTAGERDLAPSQVGAEIEDDEARTLPRKMNIAATFALAEQGSIASNRCYNHKLKSSVNWSSLKRCIAHSTAGSGGGLSAGRSARVMHNSMLSASSYSRDQKRPRGECRLPTIAVTVPNVDERIQVTAEWYESHTPTGNNRPCNHVCAPHVPHACYLDIDSMHTSTQVQSSRSTGSRRAV